MININFELVSFLKKLVEILNKDNEKQEQEKEKLKQGQVEKLNIQYILRENRKAERKWRKMWE